MKVEVNPIPLVMQEIKYPRLLTNELREGVWIEISEGTLLCLFTGNKVKNWEVGELQEGMNISHFTPFTGSVTLSNE